MSAGIAVGGHRQRVAGFGRASASVAVVERVRNDEDLERLVVGGSRRVAMLARGLGRSYGDASQCAGGTVIDCTALDRILDADFASGVVRVEAGCSIETLLRVAVPNGWFVPVTPGTRHVTVGGAIAADVHGKNHHVDGSFGEYVEQLSLITPSGRVRLARDTDPDLFWATVGGMGLTGIIADATIRLLRIETALVRVDTERVDDLACCMSRLETLDARQRYSVAWVDGLARGRHLGRSVITSGDHARRSDLPSDLRSSEVVAFRPTTRASVPFTPPLNLLRRELVAVANRAWFGKAPRSRVGEVQTITSFFHPLDALADWNRLYGPRGFTQYQFVVPFEAADVVQRALETVQAARLVPSLVVLKSFGAEDPAPLSFPKPGWTLAIDLAIGSPGMSSVLDGLDEIVAAAGGRVYLAKDGRLRPDLFSAMYPRLEEWLAVKSRVDPDEVFVSDLWRRLHRSS